jgi:pilus assembly protein CpaF
MVHISISTKSGTHIESFHWGDEELLIGKSKECGIILHGWRVDKVHAKIFKVGYEQKILALDGNKVILNTKKIVESELLRNGDVIEIGDYCISIKEINPGPNKAESEIGLQVAYPASEQGFEALEENFESIQQSNLESEAFRRLSEECRSKVHRSLLSLMDLRRVNVGAMSDQELRIFTSDSIREILENDADFPLTLDKLVIARQVLAEAVGLGPLEDLLDVKSWLTPRMKFSLRRKESSENRTLLLQMIRQS